MGWVKGSDRNFNCDDLGREATQTGWDMQGGCTPTIFWRNRVQSHDLCQTMATSRADDPVGGRKDGRHD